ncbi:hypothetical protein [Nitratireductor sp. PBL-C9]|uniref:hypothetical protein n=1 Tax=Nitratireductor sp. PBL-C9 TaxID=3435013 RepID=UPI003D7ECF3C
MYLTQEPMHQPIEPVGPQRIRSVRRRNSDWTMKEHEVIVSHWPDIETIEKCLPHRSRRAIRAFAGKCNLTTSRHVWTAAEDMKLRKLAAAGESRRAIASEMGMSLNQIAGRMAYAGISLARKPPKPSTNLLVNAVRQRAFELHMTLSDLDRSLGSRKIFQQASGSQRVAHTHIERAVKALGGRLVVEWCDE